MANNLEQVVSYDTLTVGQLYTIRRAIQVDFHVSNSIFSRVRVEIINDDGNVVQIYIQQTLLQYALSIINDINAAYLNNEPYYLCYYGSITTATTIRYISRIHPFNTGVNAALLEHVQATIANIAKANNHN